MTCWRSLASRWCKLVWAHWAQRLRFGLTWPSWLGAGELQGSVGAPVSAQFCWRCDENSSTGLRGFCRTFQVLDGGCPIKQHVSEVLALLLSLLLAISTGNHLGFYSFFCQGQLLRECEYPPRLQYSWTDLLFIRCPLCTENSRWLQRMTQIGFKWTVAEDLECNMGEKSSLKNLKIRSTGSELLLITK